MIWDRADTVIWLDPPERWRNLLTWDQQESVISWAWHHYPIYRERYTAAAHDPAYSHLTFTRIATRADLHRLLESIR